MESHSTQQVVDFGPPGPKYLDNFVRDFGPPDQIFRGFLSGRTKITRTQIAMTDSGLYGALSDSMGLSPGTNSTSMIVTDIKVRLIIMNIIVVNCL